MARGESTMKADYIKNIIESYDKSPYECILIDGPWGVGKSYAVEAALVGNNRVCSISMFGLEDAQEIYHEVFYRLIMKDKRRFREFLSKAMDVAAKISSKMAVAKEIIQSLVKEKEMFLDISKSFDKYHFIVIDDLERMNNSIELEEVFGIVDELKRCNYVKVILVANTKGISQQERFNEYSEKVIDRTYHITEPPQNVDWAKLRIHNGFITEFLSIHQVKNLRTLQKAQNLYDDVRLKITGNYKEEFYDEIRLACYAIVVETIDKLYYREIDDSQSDSVSKMMQESRNELDKRISISYLQGLRISKNMVEMLKKYYENEIEITEDQVDVEYQIFLHAGEKPNYYKSDAELMQILPDLAEKIRQETNIGKILSYADEYFTWSNYLQLDVNQLKEEYRAKLHNMIYEEAKKGNMEYLTYGIETFYVQSQTNKDIVVALNEAIKVEAVCEYVRYLSENTYGKKAYHYSYTLRKLLDNVFFKKAFSNNVDALYNEKSFPIYVASERQYETACNIMYVLYHENKEKFLAYCDEIKTKCDKMATHRIDTILKEIEKK